MSIHESGRFPCDCIISMLASGQKLVIANTNIILQHYDL